MLENLAQETEIKESAGANESGEAIEGKEQDPAAEKEKAKKRLSDRLRETTWKMRTKERENEALRKENDELKAGAKIKAEPDPDDYADRNKYHEDREAWKTQEREKIRAEEAQNVRKELTLAEKRAQVEKQKEAYISGRVEAIKEDPKFHEYELEIDRVVEAFDAPEIQDLILAAKKNGPRIVSHLGANPDELEEIASASPRERSFLMGKLVAKLEAKPAKTISSAPNPTRSEKGGAQRKEAPKGLAFDKTKETFSEYSKRVNSSR